MEPQSTGCPICRPKCRVEQLSGLGTGSRLFGQARLPGARGGEDGMRAQERATAEGLLYADLYQLTMAQLYYFQGLHEQEAQFDYFFRTNPDYGEHQAGY